MGMYGDTNYMKNDLYDSIKEFLDTHPVSELMQVVADAIEAKEILSNDTD